jgi:hypothetical protein
MQTYINSQVGTITLSGNVWTVIGDQGYKYISLKLVSGTVTYQGSLNIIIATGIVVGSTPQTLDASGFFMGGDNPIHGLTIDATLGVVEITLVQ